MTYEITTNGSLRTVSVSIAISHSDHYSTYQMMYMFNWFIAICLYSQNCI